MDCDFFVTRVQKLNVFLFHRIHRQNKYNILNITRSQKENEFRSK